MFFTNSIMKKSIFLVLIVFLLTVMVGCDTDTQYSLTIEIEEGEGTVTPFVNATEPYDEGTQVTIKARPDEGWEFDEWIGEVKEASNPETTVIMNKDQIVKARFKEGVYSTLKEVKSFEEIEVPYSTDLKKLKDILPSQVTVEVVTDCENNIEETIVLEWDFKNYDGDKPDTYVIEGNFSLPYYISNPKEIDLKVEMWVTVKNPVVTNIEWSDVYLEVDFGTEKDKIGLANEIRITASDNIVHTIGELNWEIVDYDPNVAGKYEAIGSFELPYGIDKPEEEMDLEVKATIIVAFAGGDGSEESPYLVSTATQLNRMREHLDSRFKQVEDIDLSEYSEGEGWQPIGDAESPFTGSYDGYGKTISELYINRDENYVALFGFVDVDVENAVLKNINLKAIDVRGNNYVGGLVGFGNVAIENVHVEGTISGKNYVGGLLGRIVNRDVYYCYFEGNITAQENVGGLAGKNRGKISNSYSTGKVDGENNVGGLVGENSRNISNSHSTATVIGIDNVGGLVGENSNEIINSYSTGKVDGENNVGGLVGENDYGEITNSYYDEETSNQNDTGKGEPKTTEDMMQEATFDGWDFENVWIIEEDSYPQLRN
ncbi:GLUG motif-containing protein [Natronospora cellulosivora (SeqCode)]